MVKLPSLRRSERSASPEHDERDQPAGHRRTATSERRHPETSERPHAYSAKVEQAAERAADATRTAAAAAAQRANARPRTSALAGLGLVVATVAALTVATGTLAGLGIAVGVLAVLVAIAGLAATSGRSTVRVGRTEATVALLLALGAIVVGSLAATGALSWLDTGTDQVTRLRDWLPGWLT